MVLTNSLVFFFRFDLIDNTKHRANKKLLGQNCKKINLICSKAFNQMSFAEEFLYFCSESTFATILNVNLYERC